MKLEKGTFSIFPCAMCKGLHPYQQVLMAWLFKHANDDGICWPSLDILANECGLSKNSVIRHIKILEEKEYLIKERRKNKNDWASSSYKLLIRDTDVVPQRDNPLCHRETTLVPQRDKGVVPQRDSNYIHNQLNPRTKSKKHSCDKSEIDFSPEFESSWNNYPKRDGTNSKRDAWKQWQARIKEGESIDNLQIATDNFSSWIRKTGKEHTPFVMQAQRFYGKSRQYEEFIQQKPIIINQEQSHATNPTSSAERKREIRRTINAITADVDICF